MTMNERRAEIMRILTARRSITMPELALRSPESKEEIFCADGVKEKLTQSASESMSTGWLPKKS